MVALAVAAFFMAGCSDGSTDGSVVGGLGDPEPAASSAPLEIVLDTCTINRPTVAPGSHEVSLIGSGTVAITDESGAEVATLTTTGAVTTAEGTYTFTCSSGGVATGKVTVESTP
ncbi:MAG: hypothetical protein LCH66_14100 [Actinobacteria bacterium]|nr:hypothetical protein [Actinomycetota bacterium]